MTVKVGDKVPAATMKVMGAQGPADLTTAELFAGKKVVLFAVPGENLRSHSSILTPRLSA